MVEKQQGEFHVVFWLVRHGETEYNKSRCIQGHKDIELNATGEQQAKQVAQTLCQQFKTTQHSIYPTMYSSDLQRAHKTALIFKEVLEQNLQWDLAIQTHQGLRERYFGDLEGKPYGSSNSNLYSSTVLDKEETDDNSDKEDDNDESNATINRPQSKQWKEPETLEHLQDRVLETVFSIAKQYHSTHSKSNDILLFMHGGSIKILLCWALGLSSDSLKKFRIDNVAISKLDLHFVWHEQDLQCTQQHVSQLNWVTHLVGQQN